MNKTDYFNTVTLQTDSLFDLAPVQVKSVFNTEKLNTMMSLEEFASIKKVVITGCGDSYSAAGAVRSIFANVSHISDVYAPDVMDFTTFWTPEDIQTKKGNTLVIAVSASGGSQPIKNILDTGRDAGAKTMLVTNNTNSKNAEHADYVFDVETPALNDVPGIRSYMASMFALIALGAHIGVANGFSTNGEFVEIGNKIIEYVASNKDAYDDLDTLSLNVAMDWKEFRRFEMIGDGPDWFSSLFVEQKLIECAGYHTTHVDSEDWSHINIFLKNPESIGTVIHAFKDNPSFSRLIETTNSAAKMGRPVLLVTDAVDVELDPNIRVSLMASPSKDYPWMSTLFNFVPGALLSGYLASVVDKNFFGGRYDYKKQEWLV